MAVWLNRHASRFQCPVCRAGLLNSKTGLGDPRDSQSSGATSSPKPRAGLYGECQSRSNAISIASFDPVGWRKIAHSYPFGIKDANYISAGGERSWRFAFKLQGNTSPTFDNSEGSGRGCRGQAGHGQLSRRRNL